MEQIRQPLKIYLASGWFKPGHKETMDDVRSLLVREGYQVFAPYYDSVNLISDGDTPENRMKAFDDDTIKITECNLVVAIIDDFDPGVMFEMGYAYNALVPILGFTNIKDRGLNVMLQQAVWGFSNGLSSLRSQLSLFSCGKSAVPYEVANVQ